MASKLFSRHFYQLLRTSEDTQESCSLSDVEQANHGTDKATTEPHPSPAQASVWKTILNLVNYIEGVGFLALPYAVYRAGIFAIAAFLFEPLICWYVTKVLIDCLYEKESAIKNGEERRIRVRSTYRDC